MTSTCGNCKHKGKPILKMDTEFEEYCKREGRTFDNSFERLLAKHYFRAGRIAQRDKDAEICDKTEGPLGHCAAAIRGQEIP